MNNTCRLSRMQASAPRCPHVAHTNGTARRHEIQANGLVRYSPQKCLAPLWSHPDQLSLRYDLPPKQCGDLDAPRRSNCETIVVSQISRVASTAALSPRETGTTRCLLLRRRCIRRHRCSCVDSCRAPCAPQFLHAPRCIRGAARMNWGCSKGRNGVNARLAPIGENPRFGTCHRDIDPSARR